MLFRSCPTSCAPAAAEPHPQQEANEDKVTPKKPKKPTTAELLQQLVTQVAELRGRVEKLESRGPSQITVYREPEPQKVWWSFW